MAGQTLDDLGTVLAPSRWRRVATLLVALGVVAAASYGAYRYWFQEGDAVAPVAASQTATAARGTLASTLTTAGTAAASLTSRVTFQTSGVVRAVEVGVGDTVQAGQVLARLDERDAQRRLQTALVNVATAKLRLEQLQQPPTSADVATAQAGVLSARQQVVSVQLALYRLIQKPSAIDYATADAAIAQGEASIRTARVSLDGAYASLLAASTAYCSLTESVIPCEQLAYPLRGDATRALLGTQTAITLTNNTVSRAAALLQANNAYLNQLTNVRSAEQALELTKLKRAALDTPPDTSEVWQAQAQLANAEFGVATAQARAAALNEGPAALDLALQREAVRLAEIAAQTAAEAVTDLTLRAPFAGSIAAVGIAVGDQAGAGTAAFTLTDPDAIRVDLTVGEADFAGLAVGQLGLATFEALPNQQFFLRVRGISRIPTVTQGVVTYAVQTEILRGEALAQQRAQIMQLAAALGGGARAGGAGGGAAAAAAASATPSGTRPAGVGTRPAGAGTPVAGGFGARAGAGGTPPTATAALPAAGMNASVSVLLKVDEGVLLVPSSAVRRSGRQSFVIVRDAAGADSQRNVTVSGTNGQQSAIAAGLEEGETVVIGASTAVIATARAGATTGVGGGGGGQGPPGGFGGAGGGAGGVR
ncbi:MAG: HlyD family efflux transporter periplasmic adaptor subunit [Dehalococcoidia bacterium]|nr:HlyD family efflux transporter periplasmic adaptor subunit [Dehalococcoidia bacterium]